MTPFDAAAAQIRLIQLLRERSARRGRFTLASGRESDLYVDVKQTSLWPEGAFLIARLMIARLNPDIVAVGGPTLGADPIVCAIAPVSHLVGRPLPAFIVRKEAKGHGTQQWLEGHGALPAGARVAVLEDTTTTGGSLLKAVLRVREAGLVVAQCLTVVDRQEGASEALAAEGLTLDALVTRADLFPPGDA